MAQIAPISENGEEIPWLRVRYEHPAANLLRKQEKSRTLRMGGVVELSQLA